MKLLSSLTIFACSILPLQAQDWYTETLHDPWRQSFRVSEVLYEQKTDYQHLIIFQNPYYGRVLALDGDIQTTERDEFVYSEMMTHTPLLAHGNAKNVLIIGAGDGCILREVLRHNTVEKAVLVEIDSCVVNLSKQFLPMFSQGAFEDPRAEVIIQDGCQYVKNAPQKFDVIICDSSDPFGPSAVLFTEEFYRDCHDLLTEGGIFVNQNGVPFMQASELPLTYNNRKASFKNVGFYLAAVPTYVGGFMTVGWASDSDYRNVTQAELESRLQNVQGDLKYYTPAVHKASFALPKFIQNTY